MLAHQTNNQERVQSITRNSTSKLKFLCRLAARNKYIWANTQERGKSEIDLTFYEKFSSEKVLFQS